MKFIRRWGLMYSTYPENVQEHSLRVAQIAHALAVIRNRLYGGDLNAERAAVLALYHDASEVLTGDLPTPVKYFNPDIAVAYRAIEKTAREKLVSMVPEPLRGAYRPYFETQETDGPLLELVRAADKICGYIKSVEEISTGSPARDHREDSPSRGPLLHGHLRGELPPDSRRAQVEQRRARR